MWWGLRDVCFLLTLLDHAVLRPSAPDPIRREVNELWMSRRIGRRMGIHWTMMVPVISEEYLVTVST